MKLLSNHHHQQQQQQREEEEEVKPAQASADASPMNKSPPSPTSLLLPHSPTLLYEPTSVLEVPHHLDYLLSHNRTEQLLDLPAASSSWSPQSIVTTNTSTASSSSSAWDPLNNFLLSDQTFPTLPTNPSSLDPSLLLHNLLRAALAIDSGNRDLALRILTALHPHLPSPSGPALHRSAFYFKDALRSLLLHGDSSHHRLPTTPLDLVGKIAAHRVLHDLSPVPLFTSFTANQAILEALPPSPHPLHLVDFDLGLGGHWSSLLRDLADVASPPAYIRLTAVAPQGEVSSSSIEAALAAENLRDFAGSLGLRFSVEVVRGVAEVRVAVGETVAVAFTPWVEEGPGIAAVVRGLGARVAVMVDGEPWWWGVADEAGMRGRVAAGVEWYAAAMEAVETASGGEEEEVVGRVEAAVLAGKVAASVARGWSAAAGGRGRWWWESMEAAGMLPVTMSDFTEAQARLLASAAGAAGYHVGRSDGGLMLTWQGVDLAATYAWTR